MGRRYLTLLLLLISPSPARSAATVFSKTSVGSVATLSVVVSSSNASQISSLRLIFGVNFAIQNATCSIASSCSVQIAFSPKFPGFSQDSVEGLDVNGAIVASMTMQGFALGPEIAFYPGLASVVAGTGAWGYSADPGPAKLATFANPQGIAVDPTGNIFVSDTGNHVVREITTDGRIQTVAGTDTSGYSGDAGLAIYARLNTPTGLTIDGLGDLFIADTGNNVIRKVDPMGIIRTVAGGGTGASGNDPLGDNGPATGAVLAGPTDVQVGPSGALYIADSFHGLIRKVDTLGLITVVAGGGVGTCPAGLGNGGPAVNASLDAPQGIALDANENIYVADTGHHMIRVIAGGVITEVAGTCQQGYTGDQGWASNANLSSPATVRLDAAGDVYISDTGNQAIRQVLAGSGLISTLATLQAGTPNGLAVDAVGNLYIADSAANQVRQVAASFAPLTFPATPVGAESPVITQSVENIGTSVLTLASISTTNPFLQLPSGSTNCSSGMSLLPGLSCHLAIALVPATTGSATGTLTLTSNTLNQASAFKQVALAGPGIAATVSLSSAQINLGSSALSQASAAQSFVVRNQGTTAITIQAAQFSGFNSGDFSVSSLPCTSISAGSSCTATVTFSPTQLGSRVASLTLTEMDSTFVYVQTVFLSGTGVNLSPTITPSAVAFGWSPLNVAATPQTIVLANPDTSPIQSLRSSFSAGSDFVLTNSSCGGTVSAGGSCSLTLAYTPTVSNLETGTLTFSYSNTSGAFQQTVQLSGAGAIPLRFVPLLPCRVVDTRSAPGPLGGPQMAANTTRTFQLQSMCGIPSNAAAYSLNVTAVPNGLLGYLSIWPTGQTQPASSTLNSDGRVKANAAIVPAGINGSVNVGVTGTTYVILDVNGYFVPATLNSGLAFYPVSPCRVMDTRLDRGALGSPSLAAGQARSVPVLASTCGIPFSASAYSLNFTVIPNGYFGHLTVWPTGSPQPEVSTLNDSTGTVTANAAIVPAGRSGEISVYGTETTDLLIDINGYFAPWVPGGLSFYTIPPCRPYDSRLPPQSGALVKGSLKVNLTAGTCGLPSAAEAYATNVTVVPQGYFGLLALWPDLQARPDVSTLNAYDGIFASNMAIVPTANQYVDAYLENPTSFILDVSGYFAP